MFWAAEEHVRSYLEEVMAHFWRERAEGFAAGQMPPLGEPPAAAWLLSAGRTD
jgi:hypothetical protein